jgi:hypothetical protein
MEAMTMDDWNYAVPRPADDAIIYIKCRYGDVYGPIPAEIISDEAWDGNMFHASHDVIGWRLHKDG